MELAVPLVYTVEPVITTERLMRRYKTDRQRVKLKGYYDAMLAEANSLAIPSVLVEEFERASLPDAIRRHLQPGEVRAQLAICTLGAAPELEISSMFADDPAAAIILDEVCLEMINWTARHIHRQARASAQAQGLKAGPPYRPGLPRWPIEVQSAIFDALPADSIGVSLNDSLVMSPIKSTSLIIPFRDQQEG